VAVASEQRPEAAVPFVRMAMTVLVVVVVIVVFVRFSHAARTVPQPRSRPEEPISGL
jgi:hypothetical protein